MDKKLKNIKVLVWDVDGTLYQSIPELWQAGEKRRIELLKKVKKIPLSAAEELLQEKRKIYHSSTRTLVKLGCGDIADVGREIEVKKMERFVKEDPQLVRTFEKLADFRHIALRNGTFQGTIKILKALGLGHGLLRARSKRRPSREVLRASSSRLRSNSIIRRPFGPFEKVFGTVDDFGTVKPDSLVFEKILAYTKLPAEQHLMIGDRVEVDLLPAKKLGMRTCLVWGKTDHLAVDICLSTIYDVVKIVISN